MFLFEKKKFGQYNAHILRNPATGEFVEIIPDRGVNINILSLKKGDTLVPVIKGSDSFAKFKENEIMFEGAKLFPWAGRLKDGKFKYNGSEYVQPDRGIHGHVYKQAFELTNCDLEKGILTYSFKNQSEKYFPFSYSLTVNFILDLNGFTVNTIIENLDEYPFPFADGWHPYFHKGIATSHMELRLDCDSELELTKDLVPSGNFKSAENLKNFISLKGKKMDSCFKLSNKEKSTHTLLNKKTNTFLDIWQESGKDKYNYLVVFIPDSEDTIAIEPWTAPPNALNDSDYYQLLQPGDKRSISWGINLR